MRHLLTTLVVNISKFLMKNEIDFYGYIYYFYLSIFLLHYYFFCTPLLSTSTSLNTHWTGENIPKHIINTVYLQSKQIIFRDQ